jgi:hypothetical protein
LHPLKSQKILQANDRPGYHAVIKRGKLEKNHVVQGFSSKPRLMTPDESLLITIVKHRESLLNINHHYHHSYESHASPLLIL